MSAPLTRHPRYWRNAVVGICLMIGLGLIALLISQTSQYGNAAVLLFANIVIGILTTIFSVLTIRAGYRRTLGIVTLVLSVLLNPAVLFGILIVSARLNP
ncbi:MAG: hypothetical protein ABJA94_08260 [Rhodoglobus sp.]